MHKDDPRQHIGRLDISDEAKLAQLAFHRERADRLRREGFEMDPDPDAMTERMGLEMDAPIHLPNPEVNVDEDVLGAAEMDDDFDVVDELEADDPLVE